MTHNILFRDNRGSTVIQFVLVLPIFIIIVFGSYEVWKLVHLKQTLEAATIQATRYLSVEGPYLSYPEEWRRDAHAIVAEGLVNESFLQDELESARLTVGVNTWSGFGQPECPGAESMEAREAVSRARSAQFVVNTELEVTFPINIPFVRTGSDLRLTESHWRFLDCGPNTLPTPNVP